MSSACPLLFQPHTLDFLLPLFTFVPTPFFPTLALEMTHSTPLAPFLSSAADRLGSPVLARPKRAIMYSKMWHANGSREHTRFPRLRKTHQRCATHYTYVHYHIYVRRETLLSRTRNDHVNQPTALVHIVRSNGAHRQRICSTQQQTSSTAAKSRKKCRINGRKPISNSWSIGAALTNTQTVTAANVRSQKTEGYAEVVRSEWVHCLTDGRPAGKTAEIGAVKLHFTPTFL